MSTTRGYPASSRSSTMQVVLAPVASFVTVRTVPKGRVGLAQRPGGASAYQVAWPCSESVAGRVVVVVTGGVVVVVTGVEACSTVAASGWFDAKLEGALGGVDGTGAVVGVVVVVVVADW
jgi:hypothetical protein